LPRPPSDLPQNLGEKLFFEALPSLCCRSLQKLALARSVEDFDLDLNETEATVIAPVTSSSGRVLPVPAPRSRTIVA
jgi:hypothetical protein